VSVAGGILKAVLAATMSNRLLQKVRQVEERLEARLGLAVLDEESGQQWTYHADQRFPLCSTFKVLVLASGAFFAHVDRCLYPIRE